MFGQRQNHGVFVREQPTEVRRDDPLHVVLQRGCRFGRRRNAFHDHRNADTLLDRIHSGPVDRSRRGGTRAVRGMRGANRNDDRLGARLYRILHLRLRGAVGRVDLIPERRLRDRGDVCERNARPAADDHQRLPCRRAFRRGELGVRMKSLLIGDRRDDDRREVILAEEVHREVHVGRRDVHPRPQRDAIEERAIAAGDERERRGLQLLLRLFLELEDVDELFARRHAHLHRRLPWRALARSSRRSVRSQSSRRPRFPPRWRQRFPVPGAC